MLEPIFSWKNGYKKDIGSKELQRSSMTNTINWWKKVTDRADLHYSKFQTEDGTPIDTGVIKENLHQEESLLRM